MNGKTDRSLFEFKLKFDGVKIIDGKMKDIKSIKRMIEEVGGKFK